MPVPPVFLDYASATGGLFAVVLARARVSIQARKSTIEYRTVLWLILRNSGPTPRQRQEFRVLGESPKNAAAALVVKNSACASMCILPAFGNVCANIKAHRHAQAYTHKLARAFTGIDVQYIWIDER